MGIVCDVWPLFQEDALRRKESEIRSLNEELSNTRRKMTDLEHERSNLNVSFSGLLYVLHFYFHVSTSFELN